MTRSIRDLSRALRRAARAVLMLSALALFATAGVPSAGARTAGPSVAADEGTPPDAPSEPIEDDDPPPDLTDDVHRDGAIEHGELALAAPMVSSARAVHDGELGPRAGHDLVPERPPRA